MVSATFSDAPQDFQHVLRSIQGARVRSDVALVEAPAPGRIAPYAVAINGEVVGHPGIEGSGRFVVLHDPGGQDAWQGNLRVVALVKASTDPEVGADDMWAEVAWSWIADALADLPHRALGGTVTKVADRSFGDLAEADDAVRVELRVSWTPLDTDLAPHIRAWADLMAACSGVPPLPDGVTMLPGTSA
jgi:hypothetical protein